MLVKIDFSLFIILDVKKIRIYTNFYIKASVVIYFSLIAILGIIDNENYFCTKRLVKVYSSRYIWSNEKKNKSIIYDIENFI